MPTIGMAFKAKTDVQYFPLVVYPNQEKIILNPRDGIITITIHGIHYFSDKTLMGCGTRTFRCDFTLFSSSMEAFFTASAEALEDKENNTLPLSKDCL